MKKWSDDTTSRFYYILNRRLTVAVLDIQVPIERKAGHNTVSPEAIRPPFRYLWSQYVLGAILQ